MEDLGHSFFFYVFVSLRLQFFFYAQLPSLFSGQEHVAGAAASLAFC